MVPEINSVNTILNVLAKNVLRLNFVCCIFYGFDGTNLLGECAAGNRSMFDLQK